MNVEYQIYADDVIAVALLTENINSAEKNLFQLAIRYLQPGEYRNKDGKLVSLTNAMGGETDWFIIPYSFGVAIAKSLVEQRAAGLPGFNENGFELMINWLMEMEEINDAMCY